MTITKQAIYQVISTALSIYMTAPESHRTLDVQKFLNEKIPNHLHDQIWFMLTHELVKSGKGALAEPILQQLIVKHPTEIAFIESLAQVYALQQDLGKDFKNPRFVQLANHKTVWKYRGQILLPAKEMHLEVHIKSKENVNGQLQIITDAYLWNEGTRIYQLTDLGIGIEEA